MWAAAGGILLSSYIGYQGMAHVNGPPRIALVILFSLRYLGEKKVVTTTSWLHDGLEQHEVQYRRFGVACYNDFSLVNISRPFIEKKLLPLAACYEIPWNSLGSTSMILGSPTTMLLPCTTLFDRQASQVCLMSKASAK